MDSGLWTLDSVRLDAGLWMLDSGLWVLDPGRWTLNAGGCTLDTVFWTLDIVVDWFRTESEHSFLFCLVKLLKILRVQICKELLVTLILFLYLVNFVLMLSVTLKKNTERNFYREKSNHIKSSYLGLFRSSCPEPFIFENFSRKQRW